MNYTFNRASLWIKPHILTVYASWDLAWLDVKFSSHHPQPPCSAALLLCFLVSTLPPKDACPHRHPHCKNTQSFPLCYMYKEVDLLSDSCHPKSVVTDVECNYIPGRFYSLLLILISHEVRRHILGARKACWVYKWEMSIILPTSN